MDRQGRPVPDTFPAVKRVARRSAPVTEPPSSSTRTLTADGNVETVLDQIAGLLRSGASGEIVVSAGVDGARLHVEGGRLTWIHRVGHPIGLRELLATAGIDVGEAMVREVVDECARSRRTFGEVLIAWSVVDAATLEECVAEHLRRELVIVSRWSRARSSFTEGARAAITGPSFDLATLAPPASAR